jgi:hypothetical protein
VFLVLSCLGLTARVVGGLVPDDFCWLVGAAGRLRQRAFTRAYRNAEIDMHFSVTGEMIPVGEFLARVASESPQRLSVLLDRGEIA